MASRFPGFDNPLAWMSDSSGFVAASFVWGNPGELVSWELILFDGDGQPNAVMLSGLGNIHPKRPHFSPTDQYLAFMVGEELHIVDMEAQTIIKTCITLPPRTPPLQQIAWSPTADQLALRYQETITVLDMDTGEFYAISDIPGEVVDWGLPTEP